MPFAWGEPAGAGSIRCVPEDFVVSEQLAFEPCGDGEHLYLRIRKTGQNTRWVAKQLAELAHLPYRSVSYAGLKDRHAVTEQWFSMQLAGRPDPDLSSMLPEGVALIEQRRHGRKLRQGQLEANHFAIVIRDCAVPDRAELDERLSKIRDFGAPNYFGPQRFGRNNANLDLLADGRQVKHLNREVRSFALSALRGALFNGYLAERVGAATWHELLPGEIAVSGRPRRSGETALTAPEQSRGASGLLWGQGGKPASRQALTSEQQYFEQFPGVTALLEGAGSRASRRSLAVLPGELRWAWQNDVLTVHFSLQPGSYATTVLREVLNVRDHMHNHAPL